MDSLTMAAAAGLRARMESLELLANNLANASTAGYKADREFYDLYRSPEAAASPDVARLPLIEKPWTDYSQGTLTATGNPLDLSLDGRGFFSVDGPGGVLYTRGGGLRLARDGTLATPEGYPLRNAGGRPVRLDPALPFEIARDGAVRQSGQELARLAVTDFPQPDALVKKGGNYFHMTDPAAPGRRSAAEVHQGAIENANFNSAESAVRLVSVLRQFEMLQRALALGGEMNRRAVEEVARVS
ncbi:MAG: flagellar hook basal-body protein [Acidobacteria bacterium]|nr:flagellar hook basal-body protein [Acidobacteriota bacterium]